MGQCESLAAVKHARTSAMSRDPQHAQPAFRCQQNRARWYLSCSYVPSSQSATKRSPPGQNTIPLSGHQVLPEVWSESSTGGRMTPHTRNRADQARIVARVLTSSKTSKCSLWLAYQWLEKRRVQNCMQVQSRTDKWPDLGESLAMRR